MNIQVQAKQYTSAADILAAAKSLKKKYEGNDIPIRDYARQMGEKLKVLEDALSKAQASAKEAAARAEAERIAREAAEEEAEAAKDELHAATKTLIDHGLDKKLVHAERPRAVRAIVREILEDYPGVTWEDILSHRRNRSIVEVRHHCWKTVAQMRPELSLTRLGLIFDRDHTSILHAVGRKSERSE